MEVTWEEESLRWRWLLVVMNTTGLLTLLGVTFVVGQASSTSELASNLPAPFPLFPPLGYASFFFLDNKVTFSIDIAGRLTSTKLISKFWPRRLIPKFKPNFTTEPELLLFLLSNYFVLILTLLCFKSNYVWNSLVWRLWFSEKFVEKWFGLPFSIIICE